MVKPQIPFIASENLKFSLRAFANKFASAWRLKTNIMTYAQRSMEADMKSIWRQTVEIPEREVFSEKKLSQERISEDKYVDVVVIGAGMAGILTAYYLQKQGKKVIVLEADRIAGGQTENTTAKITAQHGYIYSLLSEKYNSNYAKLYAQANTMAIDEYDKLISNEKIECNFQRVNSYLYEREDNNTDNNKTISEKLKKELDVAEQSGIKASFVNRTALPFSVIGAICFENQAQFHPLEFIKHLCDKLVIYENTKVLKVKGHEIRTSNGVLYGENIVFASHYPFPKIPGFYFVREHQERSYVMAVRGIPKWEGMYYSEEKNGLSFRWFKDILLIGGGGHRTGKTGDKCGYSELKKQIDMIYPEYEEVCHWSAQDCVTHDELPFIGQFSTWHPYWYVASGFKKWGMTTSMISAQIICDEICGRENPYKSLFTPQRCHFWSSANKLLKDIGISSSGLIKGHLHMPMFKTKNPKRGEAAIVRHGLKRYGVYHDSKGIIHEISVKCPHMGCELQWNGEEHTWDCPCHGSRFDCDGKLIDGPSLKSVE